MSLDRCFAEPAAIRTQLGAIFVSLELSRFTWLVTSLSPGGGDRMSKRSLRGGDVAALLALLADLRRQAQERTGTIYPIVTIQEAGLDGFWLHRILEDEGCESHVVDPASIAMPRRRRRAKTDRIDGEAQLRTLLAYKRGEPRVCSMVRPPTPEAEDERRICRERAALIAERVSHVNRIKGVLFSQGVRDYDPVRRDRRARLAELRTGDGRPLPPNLKAHIERELDRLELLLKQIKAVEAARDRLLDRLAEPQSRSGPAPEAAESQSRSQPAPAPAGPQSRSGQAPEAAEPRSRSQQATAPAESQSRSGPTSAPAEPARAQPSPVARLISLKGIGKESAVSLWTEGLSRPFANRRQAGAYPGLAPTPWRSGQLEHEQGVSKTGNQRLRTKMLELAWLWLIHQPDSALARGYRERLPGMTGKAARKRLIVALARKLFVALWKFTSAGVVIEGAVMNA
jgi:transposase